jgi:uncharacterized protein (TIGR02453 family)
MFKGLTEDAYRFFWELAFHNDSAFFEANRERYQNSVYKPMKELAILLTPAAQEIDPDFNIRPASVVSRIRRDTRFSHDKSMYRDHIWLGFRRPGKMISESFVLYAEFERESYGYGMGMYGPNAAMMRQLRERMLAKPQKFLNMVTDKAFTDKFSVSGEEFKRPRYTEAPEGLLPFLNRKNLSFCFSSDDLHRTMSSAIADEVIEAFAMLKPVYRFLMGLEQ